MKKISLAFIGIAVLFLHSATAQVLFTTYDDFLQWQAANGFTGSAVTSQDSDGSIVNGMGNTNAFGQAGTGGALAVQWPQTSGPYNFAVGSPGEQGRTNFDFIALLEQPGKVLTFDYTTPTNSANGSYFQLGIVVNCQGRFDQLFPSATATLGGGWTRASIDWSTEAGLISSQAVANAMINTNGAPFTYFQLVFIYNSNYNPLKPFYVDDIVMRDPPPPPAKLYTTAGDFTGWSTEPGFSNVGATNFDLDGSVTNGLGNISAPGSLGMTGSLQVVHVSTNFGVMSFGPYEQTNAAFIAALMHASTVSFDYITPATGTGTYFQAGIVVDYDGGYDQLFPSTTTPVSNNIIRASVDWVSEAVALANQFAANTNSFSYLRIGLIWNSDYNPGTTPFQIDNITAITNPPAPYLIPVSSGLVSESCSPTNGAVDPGETVTVSLALQNTGNKTASNIVATLLATGGVTSPSGSQSYGTLPANGGSATNSFSFTANGNCGSNLVATLQIQTNSVFYRTIPYNFTLGTFGAPSTNNYSSGGISVAIPDNNTNGVMSPLTVVNTGAVAHVTVSVRINHTYDGDLAIDLIHPDGTTVSLIAPNPAIDGDNFGSGATDCSGTFTVFDDSAATPIAGGSPPYAGSYIPRQTLGAINGKPAQGTWNLRIRDTAPGDTGTLYCWQLQVAYQPFACCSGGGPSDPFTTWQNHYFTPAELGNPAFSGSGADPLGKGINNTNQFLAGFNPTNSAAYPHIISVARTSGTNTTVTYLGASGDSTYLGGPASRTNVLESTTGTANGSYSNNFVSTGITNILSGGTGLGQVATMVHTNGGTGPTRYYRIRVLLP